MDNRNSDRELGLAIWQRATRLGRDVSGKTAYELEALGRQLRFELEQSGVDPERIAKYAGDAAMNVDAAGRGAAEVFTFGNSAEISAGMDALFGRGGTGDFKSRYLANLKREETRDDYDREHRQAARTVGELAATLVTSRAASGMTNARLKQLPPITKGALGERMSQAKSFVLGDRAVQSQVRVPLTSGYTRADHATRSGRIVEGKFGESASLSRRQRQAVEELGSRYRVDRWLPEHISRPVEALFGGAAVATSNHDRRH